jgi:hypothetical protein
MGCDWSSTSPACGTKSWHGRRCGGEFPSRRRVCDGCWGGGSWFVWAVFARTVRDTNVRAASETGCQASGWSVWRIWSALRCIVALTGHLVGGCERAKREKRWFLSQKRCGGECCGPSLRVMSGKKRGLDAQMQVRCVGAVVACVRCVVGATSCENRSHPCQDKVKRKHAGARATRYHGSLSPREFIHSGW